MDLIQKKIGEDLNETSNFSNDRCFKRVGK